MAASNARSSTLSTALVALLAAGQFGCPGTQLQYRAARVVRDTRERIEGPTFAFLLYGELAPPPTPPTVIRVYQLADASAAEAIVAGSREELIRRLDAEVAPVALETRAFSIAPREIVRKKYKLHEKARAVLVAALVRRPSGTGWRYIIWHPRGESTPAVMVREDSLKLERM